MKADKIIGYDKLNSLTARAIKRMIKTNKFLPGVKNVYDGLMADKNTFYNPVTNKPIKPENLISVEKEDDGTVKYTYKGGTKTKDNPKGIYSCYTDDLDNLKTLIAVIFCELEDKEILNVIRKAYNVNIRSKNSYEELWYVTFKDEADENNFTLKI